MQHCAFKSDDKHTVPYQWYGPPSTVQYSLVLPTFIHNNNNNWTVLIVLLLVSYERDAPRMAIATLYRILLILMIRFLLSNNNTNSYSCYCCSYISQPQPNPPLPPGICTGYSNWTCCDATQVKQLQTNFQYLGSVFGKCPACSTNLINLWCGYTCDPYQGVFVLGMYC